MAQVESVDVLIIGSGPAGMSTALHLVQADQAWADRIVVIEKAVHPRDKLCGGGVTRAGEDILGRLGLSFDPPHVLAYWGWGGCGGYLHRRICKEDRCPS